jgi:hypothetical protein
VLIALDLKHFVTNIYLTLSTYSTLLAQISASSLATMSFGFGAADIAGPLKLVWNTWQNTKKACGEHSNLTKEVATHHATLRQLLSGLEDPQSLLNTASNDYRTELQGHMEGCQEQLRVLDSILLRYPALNSEEECASKAWQKVVFGNTDIKH